MATVTHEHSAATEAAFGRLDLAISESLAGRPSPRDGTIFVPADMPALGDVLRQHAIDGHRVALVFPDGTELRLRPRRRLRHLF